MKLKKSIAVLALAGLMGGVAPAHAYLAVNGWKIDLGALGNLGVGQDDFTGYGVFGANGTPAGSTGINSMLYNALYYSNGKFTGPELIPGQGATPALGDTFNTDLAGVTTQVKGNTPGFITKTSTGMRINEDFELTFVATTTQMITGVTFPTSTTAHLPAGSGPDGFAPNGILKIYADALTMGNNTGLVANTATVGGGTGMNDSALIATFEIQFSGFATGSFNVGALDGQDDSLWVLLSNPYNIVLGPDGLPLLPGVTFAQTNSNTDGDDNNNGIYDTNPGAGLFAGICGLPQTNDMTCGIEDGSLNLEKVPEPGTIALLGLGLVGLYRSRRRAV